MPKLLHTGQVMIDLVMAVDKLPHSGGDVLAQSARFEAGGGFNVCLLYTSPSPRDS